MRIQSHYFMGGYSVLLLPLVEKIIPSADWAWTSLSKISHHLCEGSFSDLNAIALINMSVIVPAITQLDYCCFAMNFEVSKKGNPGSPMVRILCFHCKALGFDPWPGD